MTVYLEHANVTVPDIDAAAAFLRAIDPALRVRHEGVARGGHRWAHVGTDRSYIALQEPHVGVVAEQPKETYVNFGCNHLGWVVSDCDAVAERLEAAGYRRGIESEPHPHRKRIYYYDAAGFEWEILEYLSDDPAEFNDYAR